MGEIEFKSLHEAAQTDEQEVVWVLELELVVSGERAWWWTLVVVTMDRAGWTSSTTEWRTLRRAVGVVQP